MRRKRRKKVLGRRELIHKKNKEEGKYFTFSCNNIHKRIFFFKFFNL